MRKKLFFICLCMCLFQIQSSNAQWEIVGEDYEGDQQNQQLEVDGNGNVYLAYTTDNINDNGGKITVKKRDALSGNWEIAGNAKFSSGYASDLSLAIYNNVPYLAYKDGVTKATVVKLVESTWVTVGAADFTSNSAKSLDLAIDNLGIPYVAYSDGANSSKTTVKKFDDITSTWITVGNIGFTAGNTAFNSLAIDSNNVVYVAYQMTGTDYSRRAYVSRFNGTSWEFVKTANLEYASLKTYTANLSLAIDSDNKLFLALSEGGGLGGENVVLSHDGTAWSYYGSNYGENVDQIDLVIGNDNVLYEVYRDNGNSKTNIVYNDPTNPSWSFINPTLPNAVNDFAYGQQIAVDSNGNLFIAYQDSEFNKGKTSVYKFSKTPYANWTNVSADTSTDFSFSNEVEVLNSAISPNGVPYISYLDNNKITVAKFDGTEWISVGIPNFETTGFARFLEEESGVFVDRNNVPYVFFNYLENAPDFNNQGPPSDFPVFKLLKFDGTNWVAATPTEEVGSGGNGMFSVDNNNNIYFASTTYDFSSGPPIISTNIQKYNGTIWTTLDNTLTSPVVTILNDSNDSLYVGTWSYEDEEYSLFKFNGVSLEILGTALRISSFDPSENPVTMKLDSNNVPYISYLEDNKVVIKKINATSDGWDDINVVDLPINIKGLSFDLDTADIPYVVYKENNNETSVRKFDAANSTWNLLGISNFTFGGANNLNITLDNNNIPYVIYKDESKAGQPRIFSYLTNTEVTGTGTTLAWNDPTIWGDGTVPTKTSRVTIPAGKTVIINDVTSAVAGSITIEGVLEFNSSSTSSSTLITQTDPIGKIAFKRDVLGDKKWHVVAAPLTQNKDIFASNNALESGQGNNRGIGFYNDGNTDWTYYQDGTTSSGDFNFGDAYSVLLSDTSELQLEGSATASPVHKVLSKNTTGWNLVGNPYLAFLPINVSGNATNNMLDNNDAVFQPGFKSLYLWNNATEDYTVVNQANTTTTFVSPGQGFFINAKNNGDIFKIDPTMRSHETAVFFKSSSSSFVIELEARKDDVVKKSQIKYLENSTKGLDEGYDAGQFSGGLTSKSAIRLFTKLVEDTSDLDIDLALQVLPTSNYEEMVIPIGLEVKNTVEVTLKATISQLPADYKVFLEDKKEHKFYRLDTASKGYTTEVTTSDKKERFYLHTTTKDLTKSLGIVNDNLLNTTVFVAAENILKVNGLNSKNTRLEIYNLLGKQVFTKNLQDTKVGIDLNGFAKGFYIVKLKSKTQNEITKKIIIK